MTYNKVIVEAIRLVREGVKVTAEVAHYCVTDILEKLDKEGVIEK